MNQSTKKKPTFFQNNGRNKKVISFFFFSFILSQLIASMIFNNKSEVKVTKKDIQARENHSILRLNLKLVHISKQFPYKVDILNDQGRLLTTGTLFREEADEFSGTNYLVEIPKSDILKIIQDQVELIAIPHIKKKTLITRITNEIYF